MTKSEPTRAYLPVGRWKVRVPKHKGLRIGLAVAMLIRGIIPTPTSPVLITASITLLSMDIPRLRRWRRQLSVFVGRQRIHASSRKRLRFTGKEAQSQVTAERDGHQSDKIRHSIGTQPAAVGTDQPFSSSAQRPNIEDAESLNGHGLRTFSAKGPS